MSLLVTQFDTQFIEAPLRYEAWRENVGVFFDVSPAPKATLTSDPRAAITAANLGTAILGVTRADAQRFERGPARIETDKPGMFLLQLFTEGGGTIAGEEPIVAGDMLVIDTEQPHCMTNSRFENLTLVLPKSFDSEMDLLLEKRHSTRIRGDDPLVQLLANHLVGLWQGVADMDARQATAALEGTVALIKVWLSKDGRAVDDTGSPAFLAMARSIRRHIEQNLNRPLSVAALCQQFHVSKTQIYRFFAEDGGVANYIWERRLQRAFWMLTSLHYAEAPVGGIGFECGFKSEAHFNRRFLARFHTTPGKLRAELPDTTSTHTEDGESRQAESLAFRHLIEAFADRLSPSLA